jgi:hypothetical protein
LLHFLIFPLEGLESDDRFTPWTAGQEKAEMTVNLPKYVLDFVEFQESSSNVGHVECSIGGLSFMLFLCHFSVVCTLLDIVMTPYFQIPLV